MTLYLYIITGWAVSCTHIVFGSILLHSIILLIGQ